MQETQYKFSNLSNVPPSTIASTFNKAFKNYFVRVQLSEQDLKDKLAFDRIDLSISVGVFHEGELIGFILHGYENDKVYNGGTGVIEAHRGHQLTLRMYEFILPQLKARNVKELILEVIQENKAAFHNYQKLGFKANRDLLCYKIQGVSLTDHPFSIRKIENWNWDIAEQMWQVHPSWTYSKNALIHSNEEVKYFGVYEAENWIGYAALKPNSGKIAQFVIDSNHRRKGAGTALLAFLQRICPTLILINVEGDYDPMIHFMESHEADLFIRQFEMKMKLS